MVLIGARILLIVIDASSAQRLCAVATSINYSCGAVGIDKIYSIRHTVWTIIVAKVDGLMMW